MPGLLGKKIGMTSVFSADGKNVPCTVIEVGPCVVTQVKTTEKDGYDALQLGFEEQKENFIAEVQEFQKKKRKIANYTVDKESSLKYLDYDGQKCALIQISFFMTENGNYSKVFQDYILVKEEKHWKILAFKKNVNSNQEKSES